MGGGGRKRGGFGGESVAWCTLTWKCTPPPGHSEVHCVPCITAEECGGGGGGVCREQQGPGTERGAAQGSGPVSESSSTPSLRFPHPTLNLILTGKFRCMDSEKLKGSTCAVTGVGVGDDLGNTQLQAVAGWLPLVPPAVKPLERGLGPGHPSALSC